MENMFDITSEKMQSPHELAKKNESQIKAAISARFSVLSEDLTLLSEEKEGIYFSKEVPNTLCSMVVDNKNGFLYIVSAEMDPEKKELANFKCDILA